MAKESFEAGLGKRLSPAGSTWKPRRGKTRRDKESGAWGNRFANRAFALGKALKGKGR